MSYCTSIKVSVAVTQTSNFIVDTMALSGNLFDGHNLHQVLAQVRALTGASVEEAYVDRGYRGHIAKLRHGRARRGSDAT